METEVVARPAYIMFKMNHFDEGDWPEFIGVFFEPPIFDSEKGEYVEQITMFFPKGPNIELRFTHG